MHVPQIAPFIFAVLVFGCTAGPGGSDDGGPGPGDASPRSDASPNDGSPNDGSAGRLDASADAGGESDAGPPGPWRLETGHFYPAVMPMTLVYPRPDDETASHARHRWAYPGIAYRVPAGVVQGGAWPFHYELIEGPPGARVGGQLGLEGDRQVAGPDYGVFTWTPELSDEGRSFDVVVRVVDQEGASVEARWQVTVESARFLFVSAEGSSSNEGSLEAPMRDVADFYRGDPDDATFADRLVYFRGGSYQPVGQTGNENLRMSAGVKPMTFMAYPGETPVLDATRANWTFWQGTSDVFFQGLQFVGSKTENPDGSAVNNARNIAFYGPTNQNRITFFEVSARDIEPGAVGNDNPAFVWRPSSGSNRGQYWAVVNSTFDTAGPRTSNGPSAVSLSCVSHVVYEGNTVRDWYATGTFFDKANVDHITMRNNDLWDVAATVEGPSHALGAGLSRSYDPSHVPGHVEIAFNRIRLPIRTGPGGFAVSVGLGADEGTGPVWVYRNSIRGTVDFTGISRFSPSFEQNVFQGTSWRSADEVISAGSNVWTMDADEVVFDETGGLAGATEAEYLGTYGADLH